PRRAAAGLDQAHEADDPDAGMEIQRGSHGDGLHAELLHSGGGRDVERSAEELLDSRQSLSIPRQKLNMACSSILRLAAALLNGPPANATDCPKFCELSTPMGGAGFTLFRTLRALTLKVRL